VSLYPLMLDGSALSAVIIGGGAVAVRKVSSLVAAGAQVRVVAPSVMPELETLARDSSVEIIRDRYEKRHIGDAGLVIAATNDDTVNAEVAVDAKSLGRLVNVASQPSSGNCVTPAVHRAGDVVIAVTAGGVPGAAARIRDDLARRIDDRYAAAIQELSSLRRSLLDRRERERWSSATAALLDDDFCRRVEAGLFGEALAEWR
jgi:precorrin-2 dehydrogenase / sirohydrochlorin ferrochelatase